MSNWIQLQEQALKNVDWVNVSFLVISKHLPIRVFASALYPYSHQTSAELLTLKYMHFRYRKGTTLHHRKGHNEDLQEKEELVLFHDLYTNKPTMMIKNVRSYFAQAFRPIPRFEAERIGILEHNIACARWNDFRPAIAKMKNKRGIYQEYKYHPYTITDSAVLDILERTEFEVHRTEEKTFYIDIEMLPNEEMQIGDTTLVYRNFRLEIKDRENVENIVNLIDGHVYAKKDDVNK